MMNRLWISGVVILALVGVSLMAMARATVFLIAWSIDYEGSFTEFIADPGSARLWINMAVAMVALGGAWLLLEITDRWYTRSQRPRNLCEGGLPRPEG